MAWFKVDDKLHAHKKTKRATVEAMGLWVICGAWSAANEEDGFVPDYVVHGFTRRGDQYAALLVAAGYWEPAEKDGDTGWSFHDWADYQPMHAELDERRLAWAERQRKAREKRRKERQTSETAE